MGEQLSKETVIELAAYCDQRDMGHADERYRLDSKNPLKGGEVLTAETYTDATGEPHLKALVNYGPKGIKVFDASEAELAKHRGDTDPTLEDLSINQLMSVAEELGLHVEGRPNKVKLVVLIRRKLLAEAEAETASPDAVPAGHVELQDVFGDQAAPLLIEAGYGRLADVINAPDKDLLELGWVDEDILRYLRAPVEYAAVLRRIGGPDELEEAFGKANADKLRGAGIQTVAEAQGKSLDELKAIKGIAGKTAKGILAYKG
jgi:hypothetical protein